MCFLTHAHGTFLFGAVYFTVGLVKQYRALFHQIQIFQILGLLGFEEYPDLGVRDGGETMACLCYCPGFCRCDVVFWGRERVFGGFGVVGL